MTDLMWAAQLVAPRQPLRVSRIPVPRPGPGELLLRLKTSELVRPMPNPFVRRATPWSS